MAKSGWSKLDPSRTKTERQRFMREMTRRAKKLERDIYGFLVTEDALGMEERKPFQLAAKEEAGYWFTTDTGAHVFVKEGQTKEDAIAERFGGKQLAWVGPPEPGKGRKKGVKGGFTATGETNTSVGDLGEKLLVENMGMISLLPPGQRQNPLDMKYDGTKYAYEVKTVTTDAKEYKIKMKAAEVKSKVAYARRNKLEPGMIMLIMDRKSNRAYAYKRSGIGSYRLTEKDWHFMGMVRVG
jgi:hypothetical protein